MVGRTILRLSPLVVSGALLLGAGCASESDTPTSVVDQVEEQRFPDVVDAIFEETGERVFTVSVTLSSPYDTPDRYADAWRVRTLGGAELGVRILTHDHASEQPFTRSQSGIVIPADLESVVVEGRDKTNGWGGATMTVEVRG